MSAQIIELWGGPHEHRMRRPHERRDGFLPYSATVIILPLTLAPGQRRRVRVRATASRPVASPATP